jgi:predicted alpha/beta-fold hydrolase
VKTLSKKVQLNLKSAILEGYVTKSEKAENLYILLHGWEGSAQSTYIQLLANELYKNKRSTIFRLNFRDHGDTHHLNKELFHSCRLEEVCEAIKKITELYQCKKNYICGFSLGGNFAIRVASKAQEIGINITKVFAISPPINPKNSMLAIEKSPMYSKYFLRKWQKSLLKKYKTHPENFDNNQYQSIKSLDKLTELLIIKNTDYNTTDEYFLGYEINMQILQNIQTETHILMAKDDPVIPFKDFAEIESQKQIVLNITEHGGHCGFITGWKMHSWVEEYIINNS